MRSPDFWEQRGPVSRFVAALLSPLGWLYGASVAYRSSRTRPYRSSAKVVCVGNLTAGGTGKTPIALEIGRMLIARGARPVFLTRGYGGKVRGPAFVGARDAASDVGDEALLLAAIAPVIVSHHRAAGARLAENNGFSAIIMDDGHQNFSLAKDLSLIVVDAGIGFGNNKVMPAGPLREPVARGMQRADAIIVSGDEFFRALSQTEIPEIRARLEPVTGESWAGKRVVAFAGIGRPRKFFSSLAGIGATIVEERPFPDHHTYTRSELDQLKSRARAEEAVLVTTEKDFVRLSQPERVGILSLPVRVMFNEHEAIERLLDRIVPRGLPPQSQ